MSESEASATHQFDKTTDEKTPLKTKKQTTAAMLRNIVCDVERIEIDRPIAQAARRDREIACPTRVSNAQHPEQMRTKTTGLHPMPLYPRHGMQPPR